MSGGFRRFVCSGLAALTIASSIGCASLDSMYCTKPRVPAKDASGFEKWVYRARTNRDAYEAKKPETGVTEAVVELGVYAGAAYGAGRIVKGSRGESDKKAVYTDEKYNGHVGGGDN